MSPELAELKEQLAALIVDTAGSLHTEIQEAVAGLRAEMHEGFARLDARLIE